MRYCWFFVSTLLLLASGALPAAEDTDYELHEWGVFPIARNDAWAMSDLRAEWASFPEFFYRVWPDKRLPWHGAVEKPVIFFHSKSALTIDLKVKFSDGRPLVWWPAANSPAETGIPLVPTDMLHFVVTLDNNAPTTRHARRRQPDIPKDHWVQALRDVNCTPLFTPGSFSGKGDYLDCEKFIYYDGVMKAPAAPKVVRQKDALLLETENDFDLLDVLVIDRSLDGKTLSVGKKFIEKIAAGKQSTRIDMQPIADGEERKTKQAELMSELQTRLTAAGLNADESGSLIKVWRDGFLADKGLLVLYRIPQQTYEKWLPLTAKPEPKKSVRVGLVLHSHLEPELEAHVDSLITLLGSDEFEVREGARNALLKIGGAAFPMLEKYFKHKDEIGGSCREIIHALDTRPAMAQNTADRK
jgi:hypothetical protein